ncbi:MAG: transcription antitermination factor NusB [Planctomycetota bacterium]
MAGQRPKSARPRVSRRQSGRGARSIAIEVLNQCDPKSNYAGPILNKLLHETDQKQRATDLVLGTIRNRSAIDTVIAAFSRRHVERISDKLLNIIRIGTYELVYSPATGQHSIVNEAVENAKAIAPQKQADFVNAVLRKITRHITNRQIQLPQADSRCTLAITPLTGCEFDKDFLPDPEALPADYLSTVCSLPKWLVTDWLDEFGAELTRQICLASNRRPTIYLRPNSLKTTTKDLAEKFRQADIGFQIVDVRCSMLDARRESRIENQESSMIKIKSPRAVTQLPGFAEGLFTVQDITASQAVRILKPKSDWTILDLCAAPGVKTTQLAEATGDSATIIATDIDAERLKKVKENTHRLGIKSIDIVPYKELLNSQFKIPNSKFDCVLLDVPCSNTGVLARRIEARYRIKTKAIKELAKTQSELLNTAAQMLKPYGKICYSTCSIQKDENNDLVRDFLQKNRNFELESERLTLPLAREFDCDGGYTAIIIET